jgi:hypothetical protein
VCTRCRSHVKSRSADILMRRETSIRPSDPLLDSCHVESFASALPARESSRICSRYSPIQVPQVGRVLMTVHTPEPNTKCTFRNRDRANGMKSDFLKRRSSCVECNFLEVYRTICIETRLCRILACSSPDLIIRPISHSENERSKRLHRSSRTFELLFCDR